MGSQTPAPKVSSGKESGKQETPAVEHLESGQEKGIAKKGTAKSDAQTTQEAQEQRTGEDKRNIHDKEY